MYYSRHRITPFAYGSAKIMVKLVCSTVWCSTDHQSAPVQPSSSSNYKSVVRYGVQPITSPRASPTRMRESVEPHPLQNRQLCLQQRAIALHYDHCLLPGRQIIRSVRLLDNSPSDIAQTFQLVEAFRKQPPTEEQNLDPGHSTKYVMPDIHNTDLKATTYSFALP